MRGNEDKYTIVTNANKRKILVINDIVDVEHVPELSFEDFDAIFINVISSIKDLNMLAIRYASPLFVEKCRFKPCYVTQRLQGWLGEDEVIVDGYAITANDENIAYGIEEIYSNMRRLNFLLGTEPVMSHAEEMLRIARYAVSRRQFVFSSEPIPGLSFGFMALYYYTLWSPEQEYMQREERAFLFQQLLKLGYIRRTRFIHKIHLCPSCHRNHLLFFECCPDCGSSNLKEEPVIHHFRCANVTPESSYMRDGELICPKCKHELRHVGVDYDKPSSVYTCGECGKSFMYPVMKVMCESCRKTFTPSDLEPIDVEEFEFTPEGIKAFANNDVSLTVSQVGFLGYSSMRDFLGYIRMFSQQDVSETSDMLLIARFYVYDPTSEEDLLQDAVPPIVRAMSRFFNYKNALKGNNFYFLRKVKEGEVAECQAQMEYELKSEFDDYAKQHSGFQHSLVSTYLYTPGEDVELFVHRIEEERS